mgnify:CR=1 FL=1
MKVEHSIDGLVLTVGGALDPLLTTLKRTRPDYVALVCSEKSLRRVPDLKDAAREGEKGTGPEFKTFITRDAVDLGECRSRTHEALQWLREECGLPAERVRIDYTGGTKTMSAGAVLAAAPDGYGFVYVTGKRRDPDGLGTVRSGHERVVFPDNPWVLLEEPKIQLLLRLADLGQWAAARRLCEDLEETAATETGVLFSELNGLLEGLARWDSFDHEGAWRTWRSGHLPQAVVDLANAADRPLIAAVATTCTRLINQLKEICRATDSLEEAELDPVVLDMLRNSLRQGELGYRDEAALRCYRALELCVARRLKLLHGIENDAVDPEKVPEPLREELREKKGEPPAEGWRLGLRDSARLLELLDDPVGERVWECLREQRIDLTARNRSWLIHGQEHVTQNQLRAFQQTTLKVLGIEEDEVPRWPGFGG